MIRCKAKGCYGANLKTCSELVSRGMRTTAAKNLMIEPGARLSGIDALRGLAMLWMTVYHLCFDLAHYRVIEANFYLDPVWTWQRTGILSVFLLCAGMGQAIAVAQGQAWGRFWKRWVQIAACAALVTGASMQMFPKSYIYFGVLHGLCVMLILARLAVPLGQKLWGVGVVLIAIYVVATHAMITVGDGGFSSRFLVEALNSKPWNVLGLISVKPITEDYVPVLPWLAVMLWGVALGQRWAQRPPAAIQALGRIRLLPILGRWSLSYYMVHQPILLGLLYLMHIVPLGR
jgi:uncharacterized membrane protein